MMSRTIIKLLILFPFFAWSQGQPYLIPDIGCAGYNTQVEIIATHTQYSAFGPNGFYLNNNDSYVKVFCTNPEDTNKIVISPLEVSWHGRLITTQIFVKPYVQSNSNLWQSLDSEFRIPLSVKVNGVQTNIDTFYIVLPQPAFSSNTPEVIGQNINTQRSRRGAIIFESFTLTGNGSYEISTADCDPYTEGNQGYLPVNIISLDSMYIGVNSQLNLNANGKNAAPGGGGGGTGSRSGDGGHGFTSGGFSCKTNASTQNYSGESTGYIIPLEDNDSLLMGNYSLNGVKGGIGYCDQGAGGGTGHPFGKSGRMGPVGIQTPQEGGYGAGSAGGEESVSNPPTYGGGGGGNATNGEMGEGNASSNGGKIHGNKEISPLFGGSGGGAGNVWALNQGGSGGGGGGSIGLFSFGKLSMYGSINANGGDGGNGIDIYAPLNTCSGGGGGSGGAIVLGSKCQSEGNGNINVNGGNKGSASGDGSLSNAGGQGGAGRYRQDGETLSLYSLNTIDASQFQGPSSYYQINGIEDFVLNGKGNGETINIYAKAEHGEWFLHESINGYVNNWSSNFNMSDASIYYFAITQSTSIQSTDTFTFQASQTFSQTAANMVYLNLKPVAINDTVQLLENTSHLIHNQANDSDPNHHPLSTIIITAPNHGTASVENDTSILYTPDIDYHGFDTIFYAIKDTGIITKFDSAYIFINVLDENTAPDITDGSTSIDTLWFSTLEDTGIDICLSVIDNENNNVDISSFYAYENNASIDLLPYGDTCVHYLPNLNYRGQDSLWLWVCDDGIPSLCDSVFVIVDVIPYNNAPEFMDNGNNIDTLYLSVNENDSLNICFDIIDIDLDSISLSSNEHTLNASINDTNPNDTCIWYLPNEDYFGKDTVWVITCDNHPIIPLCDSLVIIMDVIPINNAPEFTENGNSIDTLYLTVNENDSLNICFDIIDTELDSIFISSITNTDNANINNENLNDTCFWYMPSHDFYGKDTLWLTACDKHPLIPLCDSLVIIMNVIPVNNAPEFTDNGNIIDTLYLSVNENDSLNICFDITDADQDSIIIGSITNTDNASINNDNLSDTCFWYFPLQDFYGKDTLWVTTCDNHPLIPLCDSLVIIMDVIPVNNAPEFTDEGNIIDTLYLSVNENDSLNICFDIIDTDLDSIYLSSVEHTINGNINNNNPNDTCLWYMPLQDYYGKDTLWVTACDNHPDIPLCDSLIVIIDVIPINNAPEFTDGIQNIDTLYLSVYENDSLNICFDIIDADQDSIDISSIEHSLNASINNANINDTCIWYIPNNGFYGSDVIWITACDNHPDISLCDSLVIIIDVTPINNAPEFTDGNQNIDTLYLSVNENDSLNICFDIIDTDLDSVEISTITHTLNANINNPNLSDTCLWYIPNPEYYGNDTLWITACDQHPVIPLCDSIVVIVDVIPINTSPEFTDGTNSIDTLFLSTYENDSLEICFNIYDIEMDSIAISSIEHTFNAIINNDNVNDTCIWHIPNYNFYGSDTLWVKACDKHPDIPLCDSIVVIIDVLPINNPPYFSDGISNIDTLLLSVNENDSLNICFELLDADLDSVYISHIEHTTNAEISYEDNLDTCIWYSPNSNFTGTDTLWLNACDNHPEIPKCDSLVVIIDVLPINHPPVPIVDTIIIYQGESITINLLENDYDPDGDSIYVRSIRDPFFGAIDNHEDGYITYTADNDYIGAEVVPYTICDDNINALCDSSYILIKTEFESEITIPTGFSPNGDNINDVFYIKGIKQYDDVHLVIFNRWGNMVYETYHYQNDWDGQYQNANAQNIYYENKVPDGTYYYIIEIESINYSQKGFVILKK
jgi:gliding motility-associated-like protein